MWWGRSNICIPEHENFPIDCTAKCFLAMVACALGKPPLQKKKQMGPSQISPDPGMVKGSQRGCRCSVRQSRSLGVLFLCLAAGVAAMLVDAADGGVGLATSKW